MMAIAAPRPTGGQRRYLASRCTPRDARHHVRDRLLKWGLEGVSEAAQLVTSELVTNAVLHGDGSDVGLELVRTPESVIVMAIDDSLGVPVASNCGGCGESGRGLAIVDAVCERWGWYFTDAGRKVVWGELPAQDPA